MIDIQNINGYGIQDPGFALLREVAQKYCPEELQAERQTVLPDETLNLTELETAFNALLAGGSGYGELLYIGDVDAHTSSLPKDDGFGIGIPETQKLRDLHYEEADTLNSEQIKRDFPVLNQKVNGHDLVRSYIGSPCDGCLRGGARKSAAVHQCRHQRGDHLRTWYHRGHQPRGADLRT